MMSQTIIPTAISRDDVDKVFIWDENYWNLMNVVIEVCDGWRPQITLK